MAGTVVIPSDALGVIEKGQTPDSRTELQQLMGTLGYWKKHKLGFLVLARLILFASKEQRMGVDPTTYRGP